MKTKDEIIQMYINDLKNLVAESPARNSRIDQLEQLLSTPTEPMKTKILKQIKDQLDDSHHKETIEIYISADEARELERLFQNRVNNNTMKDKIIEILKKFAVTPIEGHTEEYQFQIATELEQLLSCQTDSNCCDLEQQKGIEPSGQVSGQDGGQDEPKENKTRVFGGKDDKTFWSDKPIQPGHPNYVEPKQMDAEGLLEDYTHSLREYMRESRNNIGFDDRDDIDFVKTFLKDNRQFASTRTEPKMDVEEWLKENTSLYDGAFSIIPSMTSDIFIGLLNRFAKSRSETVPNVGMDIEKLVNRYMEEEMPDKDIPFHHEAEGKATLKYFLKWVKKQPESSEKDRLYLRKFISWLIEKEMIDALIVDYELADMYLTQSNK